MASKMITTALLAAMALGVLPATANAQDYYGNQDSYGYQAGAYQGGGYQDGYAYQAGYDHEDGDHDGYRRHHRDRDGYGDEYARQGYPGRQIYTQQGYYDQRYAQQRYAQRGYGGGYNGGSYYQQRPAAYGYNGYNQDYRYRCRNNNAGTIIGAIAGGLIGNGVAGRGDRLLGTVIGGGAGALAGSAIDKGNRRC